MRLKLRKCFYLVSGVIFLLVVVFQIHNRRTIVKKDERDFDTNSNMGNLIPQDVVKVDWHPHEYIKMELERTGPGEQGAAVHIQDWENGQDAYADNGFNIKVSDRISLNRSLPDIRNPLCKKRKYLPDAYLATASVIIPFHNEGWSTLLRTVHSLINRSPAQLLREIILVDDCSTMEHLQSKLDRELAKYPIVKLERLRKREGLIRARLAGVRIASSRVVIILDSHIEVTHNWLPSLLEPIAIDRKTVTCPMIDIIDKDDFHYLTQPGDAMRGAFDWELYYKRIPIPPDKQLADPTEPFEDPIMAGGLFAVDLEYFKEIGQYDEGLEIWGGEQYELSFKVWMCGGRILDVPCSRVGHVYRKFMPYKLPAGTNINKNYKRVAEVWMDEYAEYFYKKRPFVRKLDAGDLTQQKQLRARLGCRPFDWFMREIAPDIVKHYPAVMPLPAASGTLINQATGECLDGRYRTQGGPLTVAACKEAHLADQQFLLTWKEDIRPGKDMDSARAVCVDAQTKNKPVVLWPCHGQFGNQLWKYKFETGQLYHSLSRMCASATEDGGGGQDKVLLVTCSDHAPLQRWVWQTSDIAKLRELNRDLHRAKS